MNNFWIISGRQLFTVLLLLSGCLLPLAITVAQSPNAETESFQNSTVNLSVEAVTKSGNFHTPLDATPDPFGKFIYFIAIGKHCPGVFRVAAAGNSPTVEIAAGPPFVAPTGLAISSDGLTIYIAPLSLTILLGAG